MQLQKLYQSYFGAETTSLFALQYTYDATHQNRLYRNDLVQAANSELYGYDNLGQIKMLRRGALNADKTNVPAVNHSEAWNFDKTGNWLEYSKNGMSETRTHNAANELQDIATHDANGNMTLMPGLKGKYDAWNRLVEVKDSSDNVIASYEYNGLNQRIKKTVGGVLTKSFYNENWQEVESVTGSQMTSYVWDLRYVDDLVLREKGEERFYSLADANWNVVALVDASGTVVERIKYDAFGKITWLDAGFGVKAASDYAWNRTFTGQILDQETGLILYRNRYYHAGLGRFVNRDPIGYKSKDENLYRYVNNQPNILSDPSGMKWTVPHYFWWYYYGLGKTVTLSQTGLLGDYIYATMKEREIQIKNQISGIFSVNCDNPNQSVSGKATIATAVGGGIFDPLTVLGNSRYSADYECFASANCRCCDGTTIMTDYTVTCLVKFNFEDRFDNPTDKGGQSYYRNVNAYNACISNCKSTYNCPIFAFTREARIQRVKCIVARSKCLDDCEKRFPSSNWPGATPYKITDTWKQLYSWNVKVATCH